MKSDQTNRIGGEDPMHTLWTSLSRQGVSSWRKTWSEDVETQTANQRQSTPLVHSYGALIEQIPVTLGKVLEEFTPKVLDTIATRTPKTSLQQWDSVASNIYSGLRSESMSSAQCAELNWSGPKLTDYDFLRPVLMRALDALDERISSHVKIVREYTRVIG